MMTKITDISGGKPIVPATGIKSKEGDAFQKTLEKALQIKEGGTAAGIQHSRLGEIQAPVAPVVESALHGLDEKVKNLIDRLDVFASFLDNPGQSLKHMEPLVRSMKDEADRISEMIAKEGVADDNLKKISMESVMMAHIEYHKFYRGDYI